MAAMAKLGGMRVWLPGGGEEHRHDVGRANAHQKETEKGQRLSRREHGQEEPGRRDKTTGRHDFHPTQRSDHAITHSTANVSLLPGRVWEAAKALSETRSRALIAFDQTTCKLLGRAIVQQEFGTA